MKEFLGHSIGVAKNCSAHHCVLKCLNTEEVKACRKFHKTKTKFHYACARGICNHGSSTFIKRILHFCPFFPTIFLEIADSWDSIEVRHQVEPCGSKKQEFVVLMEHFLKQTALKGSVENEECGVWQVRSVENGECGKCGVWKKIEKNKIK